MNKNTKIIYLLSGLAIVVVYGILAYILLFRPSQQENQQEEQQPTNTSSPALKSTIPLERAQEIAQQGTALTPEENTLRSQLISQRDDFGSIYTSPSFSFFYLQDSDTFQIRLLSANPEQAKQDAFEWLTKQGLSQNGICKLPVLLYHNTRGESPIINPIPEECD